MKRRPYKQIAITPEDFVVAWTTAQNMTEVINVTGLTRDGAKQRAKRLREAGVDLKNMPNERHSITRDPLRIAQLNSLIKKHSK